MYSYHGESEPEKEPVPESVVIDTEELAVEPKTSTDDLGRENPAATFILKVQETHQLPQSTMNMMLKEIDSLYQVRWIDIDIN